MNEPATAVEVELLIQDDSLGDEAVPLLGRLRETRRLTLPAGTNDRFLDGPASRRLAVVDFDPNTGAPMPPPARFRPSEDAHVVQGSYGTWEDLSSPAALAVNAFGTALLTINMFEGIDALGRRVAWAFGGEQLLIVPRAGKMANAFYDRSTRSLQFFWFTGNRGDTVYTALSRDIVAHECGHALLDAVVPSLYDSTTPQSIAIHEAVADLIAVLMALDSRPLREAVLAQNENNLGGANAFSRIAEKFGMSRVGSGTVQPQQLRGLFNTETAMTLAGAKPHVLSTLLSAIFYDTLNQIYDARYSRLMKTPLDNGELPTSDHAANMALGSAHMFFRSLLLRGIDYLPPGELSFADVGRAALAADRAIVSDEEASEERRERRTALAERFVKRELVADVSALQSDAPEELDVEPVLLPALRDSDYLAYEYVRTHRDAIGIPEDLPFTVLPRVDASKKVGGKNDPLQRELILKVAWNHVELAHLPRGVEKKRLVPTGATVSWLWETGRCLARVRSDIVDDAHQADRDRFLAQLIDGGLLDVSASAGVNGVSLDDTQDYVTLARSHRLLHLEEWDQ